MKTILLTMDSLNRHMLGIYGGKKAQTPNIDRLAKRSVVFDGHWLGSAPCMPARRDMMTGRLNFLERNWGPIEPFDKTLPMILRQNGVFTHMITDHYHYFEIGGEGYCQLFDTWEFIRGQEWDPWVSAVSPPQKPKGHTGRFNAQYEMNKTLFTKDDEYPSPKTFLTACDWLEKNHEAENFFLMLDVFDPHEPFDAADEFLALYETGYSGSEYNWPHYGPATESIDSQNHLINRYLAKLSMADKYLGKLLDVMDKHSLWEDSLFILTTDHGHMLGEHGFNGKSVMHLYNELSHLPLIMHLPGGAFAGKRVGGISQNIDLLPTILEYFNISPPGCIHGQSLINIAEGIHPSKKTALFGYFGKTVNITDGRRTYYRSPAREDNHPCFQYAAMPTSFMNYWGMEGIIKDKGYLNAYHIPEDNMVKSVSGQFLPYTPFPVYKIPCSKEEVKDEGLKYISESLLFDIESDYGQQKPIRDAQIESEMKEMLVAAMKEADAPKEQYERLGLVVS